MKPQPSLSQGWSASPELSAETRALVACGQAFLDKSGSGLLRRALCDCTSADALVDAAIAHGMLGHLHRSLTAEPSLETDAALVVRLGELQRVAELRSLRQTAVLLKLLERLSDAEIEVMPIKGPAWGESLYGDVAMRVCADLDVLVAYERVLDAREVILNSGYADACWYNERVVRWHKEGWGHIEMTPTDQNPFLELHWEVFVSMGCRSLHGEDLLAHASPTKLLGQQVIGPSRTDGILIDCVHGTKHEWDTVERMLGLAVRVSRTPAEDWAEILAAAGRAGCRRRVLAGVGHVCRVFGCGVPADVQQALARDRSARFYLRYLTPAQLERAEHRSAREDLARLFTRFSVEDSVLLGVRHAAVRFFTPGPEDWESFPLPTKLAWLYYPVRPFRLALKWFKRLLGFGAEDRRTHSG